MLGATLGDIAGSRFEWKNLKSKDFKFLTKDCFATDDSVMTIAIASAVMRPVRDRFRRQSLPSLSQTGLRTPSGMRCRPAVIRIRLRPLPVLLRRLFMAVNSIP